MRLGELLLGWLQAKASKRYCLGEHRGIYISSVKQARGEDDAGFLHETKATLDLLAAKDPRRFQRVQKYIRYILNSNLIWGRGQYSPGAVCKINFEHLDYRQEARGRRVYAGILVHEATHGLLRSQGLRRSKHNWERMERLCYAEQNRFLAKVERECGRRLQEKFDPNRFRDRHESRWWRLKTTWKRLKRV